MITFYYLSGSPFSWKVWLALEHKQVTYELRALSVDDGDLKAPTFAAINPRNKAPAIRDDNFALAESTAIVEYLDEAYPGPALWPADPQTRASARRFAAEATEYVYPPTRRLVQELLMKNGEPADEAVVAEARDALGSELVRVATSLQADFVIGEAPTAADYALYPFVAILIHRLQTRHPARGLIGLVPVRLGKWVERVEALPFYRRTYPPHWRTP